MQEQWKTINESSEYEVSNFGRVRSKNSYHGWKPRILNFGKTMSGYKLVSLSNAGKRKSRMVSRLVAQAFIPNPLNLPEVNHRNGKKEDNHYLNLEWCTHSYNIFHAYHNGFMKPHVGDKCNWTRFTIEQVREMRGMKDADPSMTYVEIGNRFDTSGSTARKIITGQRWKFIV